MSIPFSGTLRRSGGIGSAIAKQLRFVNLKPVNKIVVKFDPFNKNGLSSTREFLFNLTGSKIQSTNLKCKIKTEILCDRSEPSITFTLNSKEEILFKSGNLTNLELLQLYNRHITTLVPIDEPEKEMPKTKSEKKAGKRR